MTGAGMRSTSFHHMLRAVALCAGLGLGSAAQAQAPAEAPKAEQPGAAARPGAPVAQYDLLLPGPLPENVMGAADAPVTIVEYASLTCPHCAVFHTKSLPALKKDYIDAGKVRFIFRDFPFDGVAMAGTMISRCAAPDKFFTLTSTLFERQDKWAFSKDPEAELTAIAKEFGFTQESFDTCLQNQTLYDGVMKVRQRAHEVFKVDSTPTLFINGAPHRGVLSPEQMDAVLKPLLAEKK